MAAVETCFCVFVCLVIVLSICYEQRCILFYVSSICKCKFFNTYKHTGFFFSKFYEPHREEEKGYSYTCFNDLRIMAILKINAYRLTLNANLPIRLF